MMTSIGCWWRPKGGGLYIDREGQEVQTANHPREEEAMSILSSKDRRAQSEPSEGSHKLLVSERFDSPSHVEDDKFDRKIERCSMLCGTSNWDENNHICNLVKG